VARQDCGGPSGFGRRQSFRGSAGNTRPTAGQQRTVRVAEAIRVIDADPNQGVARAASRLGLSYSSLYRLFRDSIGLSPKRYAGIMRYCQLVGALLAEAPLADWRSWRLCRDILIRLTPAEISVAIPALVRQISGEI
jgi:AraC-like DNA-binding protein